MIQPPMSVLSVGSTTREVRAKRCLAIRTSIAGLTCLPKAMTPATTGVDAEVPSNVNV